MSLHARAFQQACRARLLPTNPSSILKANFVELRQPVHVQKRNATQSGLGSKPGGAGPTRRAVTVTTDDGRYKWSDLTTGEKAARTTQQSFNFLLVAAGLVGTVCVNRRFEAFANDASLRSHISSTQNFLQLIPKPANSITLLTASRLTRDVARYWDLQRRSGHMESQQVASGQELGHWRTQAKSTSTV